MSRLSKLLTKLKRRVLGYASGKRELHYIDKSYLVQQANFRYITVIGDEESGYLRCDLCARLFELDDMPAVIEHIASHDGQGAAEIDPFTPGRGMDGSESPITTPMFDSEERLEFTDD